jgi:hypothetical protein
MKDKKHIFSLFAFGKTPDEVADILNGPDGGSTDNRAGSTPDEAAAPIDILDIEKLFEEYLAMPISEKQRQTLLTEQVSNRVHRLMDDIADLERVDALLAKADGKEIVSLLDIKRKIKERMAKEDALPPERNGSSVSSQQNLNEVLAECYKRVFNVPQAQKTEQEKRRDQVHTACPPSASSGENVDSHPSRGTARRALTNPGPSFGEDVNSRPPIRGEDMSRENDKNRRGPRISFLRTAGQPTTIHSGNTPYTLHKVNKSFETIVSILLLAIRHILSHVPARASPFCTSPPTTGITRLQHI